MGRRSYDSTTACDTPESYGLGVLGISFKARQLNSFLVVPT